MRSLFPAMRVMIALSVNISLNFCASWPSHMLETRILCQNG